MPNRRIPIKVGDRFGELGVLSEAGKTPDGRIRWSCLCTCGETPIVCSSYLKRKAHKGTRSCGHLGNYKARKLSLDAYFLQRLLKFYTRASKKRGLEWNLNENEFLGLTQMACFYCDSPPLNTIIRQGKTVFYNGVDRINSDQGYIKENVVSCCGTCNRMKSDLPKAEFLNHIMRIARKHG